ncbi:MAG: cytochrome C [Chloroflexi bacterium]|nr:cytochrome C [Chloroflexota bacterium]MBK8934885.1 cytochrome C [Chloroflexota bacterium]
MSALKKIVGPRVPADAGAEDRWRYWLPTLLLAAAALLLLVSLFLPYWKMTLLAPQYPKGLSVQVYANRMTGDVNEIDGLNHYIGMRPLGEAAQLERSVSIAAITILALLLLAAVFIHSPWAALLALPAILMPYIFLADMYFWMRHFGLNLDPHAPLSSAIKPFVPPIWGEGMVAQFRTIASFQVGIYLAFAAGFLTIAGLYAQRRAFKPLVEGRQ